VVDDLNKYDIENLAGFKGLLEAKIKELITPLSVTLKNQLL